MCIYIYTYVYVYIFIYTHTRLFSYFVFAQSIYDLPRQMLGEGVVTLLTGDKGLGAPHTIHLST